MSTTATISYAALLADFPKLSKLQSILMPLIKEGLLIAFSGGVDSSFLLWSAVNTKQIMHESGDKGRVLAMLALSPSIPDWEILTAKQFAIALGTKLLLVKSQELEQESYAKNDHKRCYYCKANLFELAQLEMQKHGFQYIAYGYQASDRRDTRFGHIAAQENQIQSPLNDVGLEKEEIREILRLVGFNIAEKPASPCLASRLMTGVRVTKERLHHVQAMELILREAGVQIYRVRLHQESGTYGSEHAYFRIEVAPEELSTVILVRKALVQKARQMGYRWVNLDLAGYQSGGGNINA